ncbi:hypothetical protein [Neisseria lactamica]|uniref:hypothetical protein n=1 Tax=Neisseria lactamica TaxID=486 RepID=UPI0011D25A9D|nr:hypothetical protein [Neisseria lactamica]
MPSESGGFFGSDGFGPIIPTQAESGLLSFGCFGVSGNFQIVIPRKQKSKIPSFPQKRESSLSGFSDFRHISTRFDSVISPVSVIADNTVVFSFPDSRLRGNDGGRLAVFPDKSLRLLIAGFRPLGNNGI